MWIRNADYIIDMARAAVPRRHGGGRRHAGRYPPHPRQPDRQIYLILYLYKQAHPSQRRIGRRRGMCFAFIRFYLLSASAFLLTLLQLRFHAVKALQKAMLLPFGLVAGHGIQRNAVDAAENAVLNVGVIPL